MHGSRSSTSPTSRLAVVIIKSVETRWLDWPLEPEREDQQSADDHSDDGHGKLHVDNLGQLHRNRRPSDPGSDRNLSRHLVKYVLFHRPNITQHTLGKITLTQRNICPVVNKPAIFRSATSRGIALDVTILCVSAAWVAQKYKNTLE